MGLSPFRRAGSLAKLSASNPYGSKGRQSSLKKRLLIFSLLAALFLLAAGCSKEGQSTWDALGPVAQRQLDLFNVTLWIMIIVFVLVEGVLLYAMIRYRKRPGQPKPAPMHGAPCAMNSRQRQGENGPMRFSP